MNIAETAIRGKTVTLVFAFVLLVGGLIAYQGLGRLEDPEFTIKTAVVITPYPGASAEEVEREVTDELELAAQSLGQTDYVESISQPGLSIVEVEMKTQYDREALPQVWDELRRKVGDAQGRLPPGAGPSLVNDDFGDVYGVFVAISGEGLSQADLHAYAKRLRRELSLVDDVAKVELFGQQREVVYVELARGRLAQLGISPATIFEALRQKNLAADAGRIHVGPEYLAVVPSGEHTSVDQLESLVLGNPQSGALIRLGDVAEIRRGYRDPPSPLLRIDGRPAIGLAISTVSGGNVVTMGEAIERRARALEYLRPYGVQFDVIALQSRAVTAAIDGFLVNLVEAVAIVIVVLLVFMGLRSGLIIGGNLVLTIAGTFILMAVEQVALERISLGALVIALGMLVDNAIVVVDGTLVNLGRGMEPTQATSRVVKQTAAPLLMATVVAVLGFAAIGTSDDSTGEYCGSLFSVLWMSLTLSWVTAVTITPVLCVMFLRPPRPKPGAMSGAMSGWAEGSEAPPARTSWLLRYQHGLARMIRRRWTSVLVVAVVTAIGILGFGRVEQSFFPDSTRPQLLVDYWMPRGTHIEDTVARIERVEDYVMAQEGVTQVASTVGQGAPRFLLTYGPEKADDGYAQLIVSVDDFERISPLMQTLQDELPRLFPDGMANTKRFLLGPGEGGKIQVRLSGDHPDVLRALASEVETILYDDGGARGIRHDWRERVKTIVPQISEDQARRNGLDRPDIARMLRASFEGAPVGVFREGDELLPVVARAVPNEREDVSELNNLLVWSTTGDQWIPMRQVVAGFPIALVDDRIARRDRKRTITVHADQTDGTASALLERIQPRLAELELPRGHALELGGEHERSSDAQQALAGSVVLFGVFMVLTVIVLFNGLRQPLVIFSCVPLSIVGVTAGLLLTEQPFGFMALLGMLSLVGMLIKNAIVLVDECDLRIRDGNDPHQAILEAAASRVRPVTMAALTTMLGMLPLLGDAFFVSMAVTIVFGLGFATLLTLLVVPVLYAVVFRIRAPAARARR
ncbi:efflux RND transporter permease subunit [Paraliomyxa miuraensis]|uniref:efflux RND transporter permease subunit n=1 Tax=Paraliomyxa miuraensis TaxID=376150 RepID=UPI0022532E25|nr:efflux RND transporter permease subunit [Paraliomyxa miuraensis]MCX4240714.1 efflux RND transporter permease subunit [Paraliomyxa miuraensis]